MVIFPVLLLADHNVLKASLDQTPSAAICFFIHKLEIGSQYLATKDFPSFEWTSLWNELDE